MLTSRYFGGPQGLGLSADTLATAADRLRDQRWTLAQTAAWYRLMLIAPTGFVFNALDALNTQLIQPFRKLRAALASTAASLGLFNKAAEYRDIGLDGDRWWDAQLAPLLALARTLKLGGGGGDAHPLGGTPERPLEIGDTTKAPYPLARRV